MSHGICIALTGGIASGKSTVCKIWRGLGAEVLDTDEVAHELLAPGGACVDAVCAAFGEGVRGVDGGVDRRRLAARVFADSAALAQLNALTHPEVIRRTRQWAAEIHRTDGRGVVAVPLLFECGMEGGWDAVVCVAANKAVTLQRLAERGLTPTEAAARIAAQLPVEEKAARADHTIWNNGTRAELECAARKLWNEIFAAEDGGENGPLQQGETHEP